MLRDARRSGGEATLLRAGPARIRVEARRAAPLRRPPLVRRAATPLAVVARQAAGYCTYLCGTGVRHKQHLMAAVSGWVNGRAVCLGNLSGRRLTSSPPPPLRAATTMILLRFALCGRVGAFGGDWDPQHVVQPCCVTTPCACTRVNGRVPHGGGLRPPAPRQRGDAKYV
eukprot:TRINITY_DN7230_c0_g1_i1.p2 TRINITY_DN7230_c0_g1~~TRINITY_DN7230_c0_g1_i1.p2  ORF type:complete len:170 (-),score=8.97 TRINITY_DN7230_c0_g1_i1:198-707(-)